MEGGTPLARAGPSPPLDPELLSPGPSPASPPLPMLTRTWELPAVVGRGARLGRGRAAQSSEIPKSTHLGPGEYLQWAPASRAKGEPKESSEERKGQPGQPQSGCLQSAGLCRAPGGAGSHTALPPGPVVLMPSLQLFLPLFLIVRLALGAGLLPELGNHPGLCPNQLSPSLWVDAQSTCERECARDQVSVGTPGSLGCSAPPQPFPWGRGHHQEPTSYWGSPHSSAKVGTPSLPSLVSEWEPLSLHQTCLFPVWAAVFLFRPEWTQAPESFLAQQPCYGTLPFPHTGKGVTRG